MYPIKAKATNVARSKNDHIVAIPNAEINGEIAAVLNDAVRLTDTEPELQYDSLIPTSDTKSKHGLEYSVDGIGRTRRSCGNGGCGSCGSCGCGCGCGCGSGCCCSQKSCCSTCTTCTTVTTFVSSQNYW